MDREEIAKQWIELADKDLALAEHTAKTMWPTPLAADIKIFMRQKIPELF
jgi:hypothetical protein